ncbi:MAG: DegV family protein [Prevotella sp.]|nr:DegV family protein [Staphylococcus sp.]MCM1350620.1 DegV family protein [Prevotella sp.]
MKLKIMVDSSSGITKEEATTMGIEVFPLRFSFDEEEYLDGVDITSEVFYEKLVTSRIFPKTSLPNLYQLEEQVKKYEDEGYTILIFPLSKEISGSYAAMQALFEDHPHVQVVDGLTTVSGLRFLIAEALRYQDESLDVILQKITSLRERIRIIAGIDTLEYLHRGGRLSKTSSVIGTIIGLKPIIGISNGKVVVFSKRRGKKQAMQYIVDYMMNHLPDEHYPIYGLYSKDKANYDTLYGLLTNTSFQNNIIQVDHIAPVIGCHIGPGGYGLAYIEKN